MYIPEEARLSEATEDLIIALCRGSEDRLGLQKGADEIKSHPFFKVPAIAMAYNSRNNSEHKYNVGQFS